MENDKKKDERDHAISIPTSYVRLGAVKLGYREGGDVR
jgi:hypothetical protein